MYTCPVCGYDGLRRPADDDIICPSCGTEFGYSDANRSHAELRRLWLETGPRWYSRVTRAPRDWNPIAQLRNIGAVDYKESAEDTLTNVEYVNLPGDASAGSWEGAVYVSARLFRNLADAMSSAAAARA